MYQLASEAQPIPSGLGGPPSQATSHTQKSKHHEWKIRNRVEESYARELSSIPATQLSTSRDMGGRILTVPKHA